jgi:hypothetical protein
VVAAAASASHHGADRRPGIAREVVARGQFVPGDADHGDEEDDDRAEHRAPPAAPLAAVRGGLAVPGAEHVQGVRQLPAGGRGGAPVRHEDLTALRARLHGGILQAVSRTPEEVVKNRSATGRDHADHTRADDRAVHVELGGQDGGGDGRQGAAGHLGDAQLQPFPLLFRALTRTAVVAFRTAVQLLIHLQPLLDDCPSLHQKGTDERSEGFR